MRESPEGKSSENVLGSSSPLALVYAQISNLRGLKRIDGQNTSRILDVWGPVSASFMDACA